MSTANQPNNLSNKKQTMIIRD